MDTLDPALKKWIAENLLAGCTSEQLLTVLARINIPHALAAAEIAAAQNHPYMDAARDVSATLKRRESLLRTLDHYRRMDPNYLTFKPEKLPPFKTFLSDYLHPNRPGLFRGAVKHWPARKWTPRNLVDKIGEETIVEVQANRESDKIYEMNSAQHKRHMPFGEFIDTVEHKETNDFYLTANNQAMENTVLSVLKNDVKNIGDGYLDPTQSARRMLLWIGPKGTVTPLHHDRIHNLFVQIYGRKRWQLIPAMQVPYVYNHRTVFSRVDLLDPKLQKYRLFSRITPIDVILEPGDLLYIPIGWWHHVMGETASISLNFININGLHNQFIRH